MTAEQTRTRSQALRDDLRKAGLALGRIERTTHPIGFIGRHLAWLWERDRREAFSNASDEASDLALAGNPRRADYVEHMARRLS